MIKYEIQMFAFKFILLIMMTSVTAIATADYYESLGDYSFNRHEGYQIADENDSDPRTKTGSTKYIIFFILLSKTKSILKFWSIITV